MINIILFDVYVIWKASGKLEQMMKKRREKKQKEKVEETTENDTVEINKEDTV